MGENALYVNWQFLPQTAAIMRHYAFCLQQQEQGQGNGQCLTEYPRSIIPSCKMKSSLLDINKLLLATVIG